MSVIGWWASVVASVFSTLTVFFRFLASAGTTATVAAKAATPRQIERVERVFLATFAASTLVMRLLNVLAPRSRMGLLASLRESPQNGSRITLKEAPNFG